VGTQRCRADSRTRCGPSNPTFIDCGWHQSTGATAADKPVVR
jgi:hypothetical protein